MEITVDGEYVDINYYLADQPFERIRRITGYLVGDMRHWNNAKRAEEADRVIVMDDGKVAMDGTPRQVFTQVEELRSMGLTVPDTVDLLGRLRKDGLDVPLDALTVEACAEAVLQAMGRN